MTIVGLRALKDNYIWSIINPDDQTLVVIDPGDAAPVLSFTSNNHLTLTHILITHHHNDHVAGLPELLKHYPACQVYGPHDQRLNAFCNSVQTTPSVSIHQNTYDVIPIPGHTSSHIAYHEPQKGWLFCGDTLFSAGCGRVFDGSIEQLFYSLQTLKRLPDQTLIYCAHEYTLLNLGFAHTIEPNNQDIEAHRCLLERDRTRPSLPSTLALEKKINPFLRTDTLALQHYAIEHHINPYDELAIFTQLRKEKNHYS